MAKILNFPIEQAEDILTHYLDKKLGRAKLTPKQEVALDALLDLIGERDAVQTQDIPEA